MRWQSITKKLRTEYGLVSTYPCFICEIEIARVWNHVNGSFNSEFGECESPCLEIKHYEPICRACFVRTYSSQWSTLAGRRVH